MQVQSKECSRQVVDPRSWLESHADSPFFQTVYNLHGLKVTYLDDISLA